MMTDMGFVFVRLSSIGTYLFERARLGLPEQTGPIDREVVFLLDGVGGMQLAPTLIRKTLREANAPIGTILFDWQCRLRGEIWTDLMWYRRNRVMGAKLARKILSFKRNHPEAEVHLVAYSGGAGIAVFACEQLTGRATIGTLILACPAISPQYNLAPALRAVHRAYALISKRDRFILGLGTKLFGTTDRRRTPAAGFTGFRIPPGLTAADRQTYERLREIHWHETWLAEGNLGGHTSWASMAFLKPHFLPLLHSEPTLPTQQPATYESAAHAPHD